MSSRAEQKAELRARRQEQEESSRRADLRRRRRLQLATLIVGAIVVVIVAIIVSSGGGSDTSKQLTTGQAPSQTASVAAMFAGIPQSGQTLGHASAPVTLVEFADLKCPICREFSAQALPTLVQRYVRSGMLKIVFEPQTFVGSPPGDSEHAARFALAAGAQDRFWPFAELWYANQRDENTGYATDAYIRQIGAGVRGLDVDRALSQRDSARVSQALQKASGLFTASGFSGTPSFLLGRTGQAGKPLSVTSFDPSQFTGPIDTLLKR